MLIIYGRGKCRQKKITDKANVLREGIKKGKRKIRDKLKDSTPALPEHLANRKRENKTRVAFAPDMFLTQM